MNNTTKTLIVALIVVTIGAAAFFLWPKKKEEKNSNGSNNNIVDDANDFTTNNTVKPATATPAYVPVNNPKATNWVDDVFSVFSNNTPVVSASAGVGFGNGGLSGGISATSQTLAGFPLKQGSSGANVKVIQAAANQSRTKGSISGAALVVDGIWGAKTTAAVKQIYPSGQINYDLFKQIQSRALLGQGLK